jgi:hypothetical protein
MTTITIPLATVQQALEALELLDEYDNTRAMLTDDAIEEVRATADAAISALRAALEQPNAEYERGFVDGMSEQAKRSVDRAVNCMADALEQPEQDWQDLAMIARNAIDYIRQLEREKHELLEALKSEQPEHSPDCALLKIPSRDCDCQTDTHPPRREPERPGDPCEDRSFCDHRSYCRAHQKCWYTEEPDDAQDH